MWGFCRFDDLKLRFHCRESSKPLDPPVWMKNIFSPNTKHMTKQLLPLLYFGLFAAYLAVFNWNDNPLVSLIFLAGSMAVFVQIVRPRAILFRSLFALALLFSLFYAGVIIRVMLETGSIMPFSPKGNAVFTRNLTIAALNFVVVFFWFKNGFYSGKTRDASLGITG